jgi:hypothetical protein
MKHQQWMKHKKRNLNTAASHDSGIQNTNYVQIQPTRAYTRGDWSPLEYTTCVYWQHQATTAAKMTQLYTYVRWFPDYVICCAEILTLNDDFTYWNHQILQ